MRGAIGDLSAQSPTAFPRPPMALIGLSRDRPAFSASRMSTFILLQSRWQYLARACGPLLLNSHKDPHGHPLRTRVERFPFYFILLSYVSRSFTDRSIRSPLSMFSFELSKSIAHEQNRLILQKIHNNHF